MASLPPVQGYSTGPVYIYVGRAAGPSGPAVGPLFYGTGKVAPEILFKPEFVPVYNDVSGKKPYDMVFEGEDALTSVTLTRWSDPVYHLLKARQRPLGAIGALPDGLLGPLDTGTMMMTEGLLLTLWLLFPFPVAKPAYRSMVPGYRFPGTIFLGPDRHVNQASHSKELYNVFYHMQVHDPVKGFRLLGDHDMSAVVSIPPI